MKSRSMQLIPVCLSLCVALHQHAQFFRQMHPRSGLPSVHLLFVMHCVPPPLDSVLPIQMLTSEEYPLKRHVCVGQGYDTDMP